MAGAHVVFGAGPIGRALARELTSRGLPVRVVSRSAVADLPEGADQARGDASDPAFAKRVTRDASAVYQCLGVPYWRWAELFPPLQRSLVTATQANDARYVSFENVYMYGSPDGTVLTEEHPLAPCSRKGQVRTKMAEELAALSAAGDLAVATARSSDYFGPGATWQSPLGDQVIGRALAGKPARVLGDASQPHSMTYAPDAARVLATLGTDPMALGQVWHIPNAPAQSMDDMIRMIGTVLGRETPVEVAPQWLLKVLGVFDRTIREVNEMLYQFTQPFIVDGSKFEAAFGFKPTPLETSIPATVAWWQARRQR
ncbi:NAD-dependent epimerase/dehydratase family protein [Bauldia sp.]|uniref:NAD-dependent epimerase/dehydratase family protein n=1 Tax=Bauldia sp. TaxID=2575872 RepID=UPI003BA8A274